MSISGTGGEPAAGHTASGPVNVGRRVRIMVVDDSPVVADRIAGLICEHPRLTVTDRVESGLVALARIAAERPDVVLMDLEMPGAGGLTALRRIKALFGPPFVIVVTLHDSDEVRGACRRAGADGFVTKKLLPTGLVPAVLALYPEHVAHATDPH